MSRFPSTLCYEAPNPDLLCPICGDVFDQPLVTECQHLFCGACVMAVMCADDPKCPMCRRKNVFALKKPSTTLLSIIRAVGMRCENWLLGCDYPIPLEKYLAHKENCGFTQVQCSSCGTSLMRQELLSHEAEECPQRLVSCPECNTSYAWADRGEHRCMAVMVDIITRLVNVVKHQEERIKELESKVTGFEIPCETVEGAEIDKICLHLRK